MHFCPLKLSFKLRILTEWGHWWQVEWIYYFFQMCHFKTRLSCPRWVHPKIKCFQWFIKFRKKIDGLDINNCSQMLQTEKHKPHVDHLQTRRDIHDVQIKMFSDWNDLFRFKLCLLLFEAVWRCLFCVWSWTFKELSFSSFTSCFTSSLKCTHRWCNSEQKMT